MNFLCYWPQYKPLKLCQLFFSINLGSFDQSPNLCDVYSSWAESTVTKPRGSEDDEDRIRETLAEAMLESPAKESGPSSMMNGKTFLCIHVLQAIFVSDQ